ncbi:MAG TPA: Plug domain-containing protein [Gemmatimonadaceae bacterium]|nr:Plug domain-containing protein [Gemmatimonadaceae bacterium]HWG33264.1 Plug domain-containing protein [Gemmatimonadaceae bacterium]
MRGSVCCSAAVFAATALAFACAGHAPPKTRAGPARSDVQSAGDAIILSGNILSQQSRSLLTLLKARIPSVQIVDDQPCPDVYLRGRATIVTPSNPAIYVDGQRATNTCILDMVNALDIDRVEIYPSGEPRGYLSDPYGVILIFLRTVD